MFNLIKKRNKKVANEKKIEVYLYFYHILLDFVRSDLLLNSY